MNTLFMLSGFFINLVLLSSAWSREIQSIEGSDTVVFHQNGNRCLATIDYRGTSLGYITAVVGVTTY
jgi:hypothetical protein